MGWFVYHENKINYLSIMRKRTSNYSFLLLLSILCLIFLYNVESALGSYNDAQGFKTATEFLNKGMYLYAVGTYQEIAVYSDNLTHYYQSVKIVALSSQ